MRPFEAAGIPTCLNNRLEVKKSVYDPAVHDSEIGRKFAEHLENATTSGSL